MSCANIPCPCYCCILAVSGVHNSIRTCGRYRCRGLARAGEIPTNFAAEGTRRHSGPGVHWPGAPSAEHLERRRTGKGKSIPCTLILNCCGGKTPSPLLCIPCISASPAYGVYRPLPVQRPTSSNIRSRGRLVKALQRLKAHAKLRSGRWMRSA